MKERPLQRRMTNQSVALVLLAASVGMYAQHQDVKALAQHADEALQSSRYEQAIADYQKLLKLEPDSAPAWSNLGSAWFAMSDFSKASRAYVHASQLQPANTDYAFNVALSLIRLDRCADAEGYLQTSLRSGSYLKSGHYLRGLCAYVSEQWKTAKTELIAASDAGSHSAETYYMLAIAARKANDPTEAQRAYELLRSNYPDSSFYHEITGEALDRADEDAEAQKQIEMAIASDPHALGLHAQLGLLHWKAHRLNEAEKAFREELALDDRSYSALHFLGDIAEKTNRPREALGWYRRALQAQPGSGEAHFAFGRALEFQGDSHGALKELKIAQCHLPDDSSVHYWLAKTFKSLGQKESANVELGKVRELLASHRFAQLKQLGNGVH
jgi:tetratricopeptide (TPR) repeat protein